MLHHAQITSSTLGLLEASFISAIVAVHRSQIMTTQYLTIGQPFIMQLTRHVGASKFEALDGILNLEYLRKALSGFPTSNSNPAFFEQSVEHVSPRFAAAYSSLFPDVAAGLDDLDGRRWDANTTGLGPTYMLDNWIVGSSMIHELFACCGQMIMGADLAKNGDEHPFTTRGWGPIPSKYRGASNIIMEEMMRLGSDSLRGSHFGTLPLAPTFLALCELAINPAVLPNQWSIWSRKPTWFDIQPGYRFCNMVRCLDRIGMCWDIEDDRDPQTWHDGLHAYLERVCEYMEWPSYETTLRTARADGKTLSSNGAVQFAEFQLDCFQSLAREKQVQLPAVLLSWTREWSDLDRLSPGATIEHAQSGGSKRITRNGKGYIAGLLGSLILELYFADDLATTASMLRVTEPDEREAILDVLAELSGVADLQERIQIVRFD